MIRHFFIPVNTPSENGMAYKQIQRKARVVDQMSGSARLSHTTGRITYTGSAGWQVRACWGRYHWRKDRGCRMPRSSARVVQALGTRGWGLLLECRSGLRLPKRDKNILSRCVTKSPLSRTPLFYREYLRNAVTRSQRQRPQTLTVMTSLAVVSCKGLKF